MKIIVDKNNPIEVYDTEGHLLFIHQPISDEEVENMSSDELDAAIGEAIRESKSFK